MKKVLITSLLLTIALLATGCSHAAPPTGWVEEDGKTQYLFPDGTTATGWTEIANQDYYFDQDGFLQTGWLIQDSGRYFTDETGARQAGWLKQPEGTYYLDPAREGLMAQGWLTLNGKRFYLQEDGLLHTGGWLTLPEENQTYYIAADGTATLGWADIDGQRWYFDAQGRRQTGWLELENKRYYLAGEGTLTRGWATVEGKHRYFDADGVLASGWVTTEEGTYYLSSEGTANTGWITVSGKRYYLNAKGLRQTGWLKQNGSTFFLEAQGAMTTGFAMIADRSYYFTGDGAMVTGRQIIDGQVFYFEEDGAQILLVNPWNYLPDHYSVSLKNTERGLQVASICQADLAQMLADCRKAGFGVTIKSANRTMGTQRYLHNKKIQQYLDLGYSREEAEAIASTIVAIPGTSEHQLGLAVDLADSNYLTLDRQQEEMPAQKWLMEHCWEYGFILRYPNEKSHITGIIYEPWHYRYVGRELALKIRDSGLCLEEYLAVRFEDAILPEPEAPVLPEQGA